MWLFRVKLPPSRLSRLSKLNAAFARRIFKLHPSHPMGHHLHHHIMMRPSSHKSLAQTSQDVYSHWHLCHCQRPRLGARMQALSATAKDGRKVATTPSYYAHVPSLSKL